MLRSAYVFDEAGDLAFAINVAVATGRPLLVRGPSGSGKSTLAEATAAILGWTFFSAVVTSATQWRDLCWRYDAVARLADAQIAEQRPVAADPSNYVTRGVLWQVFDKPRDADGVVVLIDEIDKAEPNVPNDLLVPLGKRQFTVEETGEVVSACPPDDRDPLMPFGPVLIVITDNEERDLPPAFLRRCVIHRIVEPDHAHLMKVAEARFGKDIAGRASTLKLANLFIRREAADREVVPSRRGSVAEFIDALNVVRALGEDEATLRIDRILRLILDSSPVAVETS